MKLTEEQKYAIAAYAKAVGRVLGDRCNEKDVEREWKASLRRDWYRGGTDVSGMASQYHILHGLRNTHGQTWLAHYKLMMMPAPRAGSATPWIIRAGRVGE